MAYRRLGPPLFALAALVLSASPGQAGSGQIPVISASQLQVITTTVGGATPLPSTRTVRHWFAQTTDPHDGVTYGYNMAGADPASSTAATVEVDITPLVVTLAGRTFNGQDVLAATLASPLFATNDYGSTPAATAAGSFPNFPGRIRGKGGALSQGDAGNSLQLQDATMRAQFNLTGTSGYHLYLHPNVMPAVTINVPNNQGVLLQTDHGVVFPDVNVGWWASQISNLYTKADATHLPLYLSDNVMLFLFKDPSVCCLIGYHGATSNTNSNGNASVQTFAWASWLRAGLFASPNGGDSWAVQDISIVTHEISEWADDPFVNNAVEPWLTPTAPQYGCTGDLETGDPVVGIGFAMGTNNFDQGANPDGTRSSDGYYHPEDEVFLPWFLRLAPNMVSEPTQKPSANVGRYSLMGDLNPFPGFRQPATGC